MSTVEDEQRAGGFVPALIIVLDGGFGPVLNVGRDQLAHENDAQAWGIEALGPALRALDRAQIGGSDLNDARERLQRCWIEHPHAVRAFLHRPAEFLERLPALLRLGSAAPREQPSPEAGPNNAQNAPVPLLDDTHRWRLFACYTDTLWDFLHDGQAHAHQHLAPLAARTRFLALSEPFRHPRHPAWEGERRHSGDLGRVFGYRSGPQLVRRARQAREEWRVRLNSHQSVPLLDHAPPLAVEDELRVLAFTERFSGDPLILTAPPSGPATPRHKGAREPDFPNQSSSHVAVPPADQAVLEEVVEHHLLPRFATGRVWTAALGLRRSRPPWGRNLLYGAVTLLVVSAFVATWWHLSVKETGLLPALLLAGSAYALIGLGTLIFGRLWAMPLMLRLPAASAVGLIVLVALHPDWWTNVRPGDGFTGLLVVLSSASFGYLLIEARNHNSGQPVGTRGERFSALARIGGRALTVTFTGAVHAFLVALLGMVVIAPVFGEEGDRLTTVWTFEAPADNGVPDTNDHPSSEGSEIPDEEGEAEPKPAPPPPEPWAILAAATAWCLAAGVFSQILWDDQPITSPLAHRRWRNER